MVNNLARFKPKVVRARLKGVFMEKKFETFGDFVAEKRTRQGVEISLRKMAEYMEVSPPFWCDIEKNRKMPSMDYEKLGKLAKLLKLSESEKIEMFDLAAKSRNEIPADINDYVINNDKAAVALRKAKELNLDDSDWDFMIEELKQRKGG